MLRGLFVTGTDTGVGKTAVSAAVLHRYRRRVRLRYWKPIQTGIENDDDSAEVRGLTRGLGSEVLDDGVRLRQPVSPHLAATRAGQAIDMEAVTKIVASYPVTDRWVVEGAGGALVPLNGTELMTDLIKRLGLSVLVVARSTLGTINHTLLTLECLRARSLVVAGVVMVGKANRENRVAIEHYGRTTVVTEMPRLDPLSEATLAEWAAGHFDPNGYLWESLQ